MPARKINPVPQIISGEKWEVRESEEEDQAYVDLGKRQMIVPLDDSDKSEMLRSHELMHVAITPLDGHVRVPKMVANRTLQAAEDCRVWQEIKRVGIKCDQVDVAVNERALFPILRDQMTAKGATEEQIQLEAAQYLLSKINTGSEEWIRQGMKENGYETALKGADLVIKKHYKPWASKKMPFESVIDACTELHKYFKAVSFEAEPPPGGGGSGEENPDGIPGEGMEDRKVDISPVRLPENEVEKLPEMSETERDELDEADISPSYGRAREGAKTGRMTIWYPPLRKKFRPQKGRKKVSTDIGVNPKNLYRATIDQKVFAEKQVRDYGVVIVVDCSGSMQVSDGQIEEILNHCPAAVIGLYASDPWCDGGYLKIVVDRKMRLDPNEKMRVPGKTRSGEEITRGLRGGLNGGNVVDLPAVEWLAKRKEETKIWVCDGHVTGKTDGPLTASEVRRISRLVLDNDIKRYRTISSLLLDKNSWWRKGSR